MKNKKLKKIKIFKKMLIPFFLSLPLLFIELLRFYSIVKIPSVMEKLYFTGSFYSLYIFGTLLFLIPIFIILLDKKTNKIKEYSKIDIIFKYSLLSFSLAMYVVLLIVLPVIVFSYLV
ncbi:MAG: hypothetical protein ACTSXV_01080 [Alphaproteobacteria bacterium]